MKKISLDKFTKPFKTKLGQVSIYQVTSDECIYWYVEVIDNDGICHKELETFDYKDALYQFYYELCWLLNYNVMCDTVNQRVFNYANEN